ncbi:MAG: hypothetical protein JWM99_3894 [Verrucomicrobiales bacterium]|nr:hypothetical protein [Verrucomicrobiales bacterium]
MFGKNGFLLTFAILLTATYCYFFTDWFRVKTIQIIPGNRMVGTLMPDSQAAPITFSLDNDYRLTSIKVISLREAETNKVVIPKWHLVSSSNSVPTRGFLYGMPIAGMKNSTLKSAADDLQVGEPYRLLLEAGKTRGQVDFLPAPATPRR